jgi:hypothetical protein
MREWLQFKNRRHPLIPLINALKDKPILTLYFLINENINFGFISINQNLKIKKRANALIKAFTTFWTTLV